jgi:hypothetical protein
MRDKITDILIDNISYSDGVIGVDKTADLICSTIKEELKKTRDSIKPEIDIDQAVKDINSDDKRFLNVLKLGQYQGLDNFISSLEKE